MSDLIKGTLCNFRPFSGEKTKLNVVLVVLRLYVIVRVNKFIFYN